MTEAIETEQTIPLLEPTLEDVFSEQNKRKLFRNKSALCDYLSMTNAVAGQFRQGIKDGNVVYELVYISEDN